ncbi:MAG: phosphoribosyl-ATP diphosphatase [Thermoguttaceae bacterium]|nr:phosphoribosyl-ATP diphosphatase [Thermoguttaceae bacterium]
MADELILSRLMAVIDQRKADRPARSYTAQLFNSGIEAISAKVREEAEELIEAASNGAAGKGRVVHEAADLFYHVLVLLAACDTNLAAVEAELARRFGMSGLEEKELRGA